MVNRGWWYMVALAGLGCGGKGDGDGARDEPVPEHVRAADTALTAQVRDKLSACGLREPVEGERDNRSLIRDELDRCIARCHLSSACEDVVLTTCDTNETAFKTCVKACPERPHDGFRCDSGVRVPHLAVCDDEEDCRNGEDEADCGAACADGTSLASKDVFCDGNRDCTDGSDEIDCILCPAPQI